MNREQLKQIPSEYVEQAKSLLGEDYQSVVEDIEKGRTHLYMFNNTLVALRAGATTLYVVLMIGKDLETIGAFIIHVAKQSGMNKLVAWTKRKGMVKYLESLGCVLTDSYYQFTLEV